VLAHVGVRNGTGLALRALHLPPDFIDAHLWWARATHRMQGHYAGLHLAIIMHATELMPLVQVEHLSPGWYDEMFVPPLPIWTEITPHDTSAIPLTPILDLLDGDSDDGEAPTVAPKGIPASARPPVARRRLRRAC
jgi:hypothetical protein